MSSIPAGIDHPVWLQNKDDLLGALALHESELQGRKIRVFKASSYQADKKRPSQGGKVPPSCDYPQLQTA